jgi:hypothetical protein
LTDGTISTGADALGADPAGAWWRKGPRITISAQSRLFPAFVGLTLALVLAVAVGGLDPLVMILRV